MALTWTITSRYKEGKYTRLMGTVAWDNSYATNGLDFTTGLGSKVLSLNCPTYKGYNFEPDYTNGKVKAYYSAAVSHTHTLFLNNADVADGATARVNAGTNLLGANTGSDISVTGVTDTTGHGGVLQTAISAAALAEVANAADLSALTAAPFSCLQM